MKFIAKNVGMIDYAEINLCDLTVIAGENDAGKSTIGKLLFATIKAISRYKEDLEEDKEEILFNSIESLYFTIRRRIGFNDNIDLREMFYPPKFFKDIELYGVKAVLDRITNLSKFENIGNDTTAVFDILTKKLYLIKNQMEEDKDTSEIIENAFKKAIFSEFSNDISNKKEYPSILQLYENDILILDIEFINNKIFKFDLNDELYFKDSTFIDTPIVLHLSESIEASKTYFETQDTQNKLKRLSSPNVILHIKDLVSKLKESQYGDAFLEEIKFPGINKLIADTINGEIKYLKDEKDFVFISNKRKHKSINTATGIKSFGIIQLLIKSGFLNEKSLLILDEPEVHLHPKWQLKYAFVITELSKLGISILVTSHSPYMVEALEKYSKLKDVHTSFHLAEGGTIKSKIDSLEKIFGKLSEPFDEFEILDENIIDD